MNTRQADHLAELAILLSGVAHSSCDQDTRAKARHAENLLRAIWDEEGSRSDRAKDLPGTGPSNMPPIPDQKQVPNKAVFHLWWSNQFNVGTYGQWRLINDAPINVDVAWAIWRDAVQLNPTPPTTMSKTVNIEKIIDTLTDQSLLADLHELEISRGIASNDWRATLKTSTGLGELAANGDTLDRALSALLAKTNPHPRP